MDQHNYKPGIPGISETELYPRRGKIRLGESMEERKEKGLNYPDALSHFGRIDGTPEDIELYNKIYGENPISIQIVFVSNSLEDNFRQEFVRYQKKQKMCFGNGQMAFERNIYLNPEVEKKLANLKGAEKGKAEKRLTPDDYVYENKPIECGGKECKYLQDKLCGRQATLKFLIVGMPGLKLWWIETGSKHSIKVINTMHKQIKFLTSPNDDPDFGRIRGIPLTLTREQKTTVLPGMTTKNWVFSMDVANAGISDLLAMGQPQAILDRAKEATVMLEGKVETSESLPENEQEYPTTVIEDPEIQYPLSLDEARQVLNEFRAKHNLNPVMFMNYALWHCKKALQDMTIEEIETFIKGIDKAIRDKDGKVTKDSLSLFQDECRLCEKRLEEKPEQPEPEDDSLFDKGGG